MSVRSSSRLRRALAPFAPAEDAADHAEPAAEQRQRGGKRNGGPRLEVVGGVRAVDADGEGIDIPTTPVSMSLAAKFAAPCPAVRSFLFVCDAPTPRRNYSWELRSMEWDSALVMRCKDPDPPMSLLDAWIGS
jgi:hypothetical protein